MAEAKKEETLRVEIVRRYWPNEETQALRLAAGLSECLNEGEVADLPKDEATKIVRAGVATLAE